MKLIEARCPRCGAELKINPDNKNATCEYCGAVLFLDDEAQHIRYDNAEEAGYKFEKGRQRAEAEQQAAEQREAEEQEKYLSEYTSFNREKSPVGLCFLAIVIVVVILASGIFGRLSGTRKPVQNSTTRKQESTTVKPTSTPAPTKVIEESNSTETDKDTESKIFIEVEKSDAQKYVEKYTTNGDKGDKKQVEARRAEYMNGRGQADSGTTEPQYVGVIGYLTPNSIESYTISKSDDFEDESQWMVPVYQKDKQFWSEAGTLPNKTEVVVISQDLKHENRGRYSGHLLVEKLDDRSQYYVDVSNFITKPYWEMTDDIRGAALRGYYVAEYNQVSDFWPVDSGGNKFEIPDGTKVLVTGVTGLSGKYDRDETGIEAVVWKEWKKGYGGVKCHFNEADLSIVY